MTFGHSDTPTIQTPMSLLRARWAFAATLETDGRDFVFVVIVVVVVVSLKVYFSSDLSRTLNEYVSLLYLVRFENLTHITEVIFNVFVWGVKFS